jgi:hypothetical protein
MLRWALTQKHGYIKLDNDGYTYLTDSFIDAQCYAFIRYLKDILKTENSYLVNYYESITYFKDSVVMAINTSNYLDSLKIDPSCIAATTISPFNDNTITIITPTWYRTSEHISINDISSVKTYKIPAADSYNEEMESYIDYLISNTQHGMLSSILAMQLDMDSKHTNIHRYPWLIELARRQHG